MNLESQVTSLELSQKLKSLNVKNVKQESLFYWTKCYECEKEYPLGSVNWELNHDKNHGENISAYTVSELMEMLPYEINTYCLVIHKLQECYYLRYEKEIFPYPAFFEIIVDATLADSLAKMLIYLIENKYLNVCEHHWELFRTLEEQKIHILRCVKCKKIQEQDFEGNLI